MKHDTERIVVIYSCTLHGVRCTPDIDTGVGGPLALAVTGPRAYASGFFRTTAQSDTERGIRHNVTFRDSVTFTYTAAHMLSRLGRSVRSIN